MPLSRKGEMEKNRATIIKLSTLIIKFLVRGKGYVT